MPLLKFTFEELPLVIETGYQAGLVGGEAELSYLRDGSWHIHSIALDGHKPLFYNEEQKLLARLNDHILPRYHYKAVPIERGNWLFDVILGRLEGEWSSRVYDAVREQNAADFEAVQEAQAERRREMVR